MKDIYSREVDFGGAFSADGASLNLGINGPGLIVQNLSVAYQQQVTRFYEVGTPKTYLVAGRSTGSLGLQRVVGPGGLVAAFYEKYGDVCKAVGTDILLEIGTSCGGAAGARASNSYLIKFSVITSVATSINAQDMIINESVQMMFCFLTIK